MTSAAIVVGAHPKGQRGTLNRRRSDPLTEVAKLVALFPRTAIVLVLVFALSGGSVSGAFAQATSTPGAATATPVACVNTSNSVQIVLENPQPGDTLISGTPVVISGVAFDPRSAGGSGVSSVMVY